MKLTKTPSQYLQHISILMILIVLTGALGGLSVVYMTQKTEASALNIKSLEHDISLLDRRIQHLDARIAKIRDPEHLKQSVISMGLSMSIPENEQIVVLQDSLLPELDALQVVENAEEGSKEPFVISCDLALMDIQSWNP